jgi:NAD(P)-dependent dehydrogenase (short-subunit alcohol dehydrogenase family)
VSLDGSEQLPTPEDTTAGRITAAGGAARAASVSVTDRPAVEALFAGLVEEFGRLDAVINVAGISRPTSFAGGLEEDWSAVLAVHLDGYLNVLARRSRSCRPRGAATSSASPPVRDGDRPTPAPTAAKRAVASLTWQLGRVAPPGWWSTPCRRSR